MADGFPVDLDEKRDNGDGDVRCEENGESGQQGYLMYALCRYAVPLGDDGHKPHKDDPDIAEKETGYNE